MNRKKENKSEGTSRLKIIPLGGLEQIGMNITAFEYEDSIIVVDCGLAFPADDMLGIDLVIPDITYLKDNVDKVKGFVITHGHEDHIGALPYVLKEINVPVYATRLTMGIIENKYAYFHQPGTVPCGVYQDQPQHRGRGGSGHLLSCGHGGAHWRFQGGLHACIRRCH